jgi:hypothetical protein
VDTGALTRKRMETIDDETTVVQDARHEVENIGGGAPKGGTSAAAVSI